MLEWSQQNVEYLPFATLFLFTYIFLLRLPSEALPAVAGGEDCQEAQSVLTYEGEQVVLRLRSRKNKPAGSCLTRSCWCGTSAATCPVHVLGRWVQGKSPGEPLFPGISAGGAASRLKTMLQAIGVARSHLYRTHDLRRGHAKDLQAAGGLFNVMHDCLYDSSHCQASLCGPFWRPENGAARRF